MNNLFDSMLDFHENSSPLTVESILLCLLSTFVLSQVVAWAYVRTHKGVSYSASLSQSLVVLSLIVAFVMLVVGNNVARAFGLFGALALIRFRTPVKDSKDTVFLFLSVALGIATGTGNFLAALIGVVVICLIFFYLYLVRFGARLSHDGLFRLRVPMGGGHENLLSKVFRRYCASFSLLHMREADAGQMIEFSYQITLYDPKFSSQLMMEIDSIEGVSNLSLLMQDGEAKP